MPTAWNVYKMAISILLYTTHQSLENGHQEPELNMEIEKGKKLRKTTDKERKVQKCRSQNDLPLALHSLFLQQIKSWALSDSESVRVTGTIRGTVTTWMILLSACYYYMHRDARSEAYFVLADI